MPAISRAKATLRVIGDDLDPTEISRLLGCTPTDSHRKGDNINKPEATRTRAARSGLWALETKECSPSDIDAQFQSLLACVTDDLSVWSALAKHYKLDIICAWFMEEGNEGEDISAKTVQALSERKIALSIDIWGNY